MHNRTGLAAGQVTNHDSILIELIQPPDSPAFIAIMWPQKPSISTVEAFPGVTSKAATLFATAATRLAQIRRDGLR
jgi:hypothetical protein